MEDLTPIGSEHLLANTAHGPTSRRSKTGRSRPALAATSTVRNLVERFFNKIKQCRRVATRYDKLAANYLAFIQLASIRLWLRFNESAP
jgi:transposase